jgi:hypothetical protein
MLIEDAADLLDRRGGGLGRMARTHYQLGFDAFDMRALLFDDPIVALLDRLRPFHGNDRVSMHAGGDR